jgi:hypothetical protein
VVDTAAEARAKQDQQLRHEALAREEAARKQRDAVIESGIVRPVIEGRNPDRGDEYNKVTDENDPAVIPNVPLPFTLTERDETALRNEGADLSGIGTLGDGSDVIRTVKREAQDAGGQEVAQEKSTSPNTTTARRGSTDAAAPNEPNTPDAPSQPNVPNRPGDADLDSASVTSARGSDSSTPTGTKSEPTADELRAEAKDLGIKGYSAMTKAELAKAVEKERG